jgi:hypothetical protein
MAFNRRGDPLGRPHFRSFYLIIPMKEIPKYLGRKPHLRRPLRLNDYDYRQEGAYFITICTHDRKCTLAKMIDNEVCLNNWGRVIEAEWLQTANLRPYVTLDAYVVMPNHFHTIFYLYLDRGDPAGRPY